VLELSVFTVTRTSVLLDAVLSPTRKPKLCMANIQKDPELMWVHRAGGLGAAAAAAELGRAGRLNGGGGSESRQKPA
jgi:hypothetical protein